MTGVIVREKLSVFERILWRACRGNVFLRRAEIETPLENPTTVCTCMYYTCSKLYILVRPISLIFMFYLIVGANGKQSGVHFVLSR